MLAREVYGYALKAMRMPRLNGAEGMLGASGRVVRVEERGATVLVRGELWSAEMGGERLAPGEEVTIIGFEGLKLRARRRPKQV